jgi:hypothetical protein
MRAVENSPALPRDDVLVFDGDGAEGVPQPGTFRCCPLGIQLYNRRAMPLYELVEFTLELPAMIGVPSQTVSCTGIVAACNLDATTDLFHIHLKFLDLPSSTRQRLQVITQALDHLCPYCENY